MADSLPLRIFVAVPGKTDDAPWADRREIKALYFEVIRQELERALDREVVLTIEVDRQESADIYKSMFSACWTSDVVIADLTGSNPNVYMEVGIRWAWRDNVTVLVTQDVDSVAFNARPARSFSYSKKEDQRQQSIKSVVEAIKTGLVARTPDNPVKTAVPVVTLEKVEYDRLVSRESVIEAQELELGAAWVEAGEQSQSPERRLRFFRRAIRSAPTFERGWILCTEESWKQGDYNEVVKTANEGISRFPQSAQLYAFKGMALEKANPLNRDEGIEALYKAVEMDRNNSELWSNLGGALRRKAFEGAEFHPPNIPLLDEAWKCYTEALRLAEALRLTEQDMSDDALELQRYAIGNVARTSFVIATYLPKRKHEAKEALRRFRTICEASLAVKPDDYYSRFDLADSYLLAGNLEEGRRLYNEAIDSTPLEYRRSTFASVRTPLNQYLTATIGDDKMREAMQAIVAELDNQATLAESSVT